MRRSLFLLSMLFGSTGSADDLLWLEREWISNVDLTVAANPAFEDLSADAQAKFKSLFGKTKWRFSDGLFEAQTESQTDYGDSSTPYFVRPIGADVFELLISEHGTEVIFEISRRANGFCVKPVPVWVAEFNTWTEPSLIECFTPYGA